MVEFFQTNRDIVFFIYGQAFFVLGLAAALQSRKRSQIALARHLWLLALFGIVHGVYEWGAVFIPIQQTYLSADGVNFLRLAQLGLEAVSFFALFQFGVELMAVGPRARRLRFVPALLLSAWGVAIIILPAVTDATFSEFLNTGDALARYWLGVPGAAAAAWGLWQQARHVRQMDMPRIARYFRGAAIAFAVYALATSIVPRADFFPASVLNYDLLLQTVGVPAAIFRAACGTLIAYLIIRGLEIFDVETDRQLEDAAQTRAVAADRERIGRDLHDGIIQSLYAAGLTLEDASFTIDENAPSAKSKISNVITTLNRTIRDIRSYILDLRGATDGGDWQSDLGEMVRTFRLQTFVDADFRVAGQRPSTLDALDQKQILAIAREALSNAGKHARATHVTVAVTYRPDQMELEIADNGDGFSDAQINVAPGPGLRQGLGNMRERAEIIGARLSIDSAPQRGTTVRLSVPCPRNGGNDDA